MRIIYWVIRRYKKIGIILSLFLLGSIFIWWKISMPQEKKMSYVEKEVEKESLVKVEDSVYTSLGERSEITTNKIVDREVLVGTERAVETHIVRLQGELEEGDLVDVRIRYPNGEEYVVLAKRGCHELAKNEGRVTFFLTEEEILCLSSSMMDCIQYDATLYTVRYLRDKKSMGATVNYIPKDNVCQLMVDNPNMTGKIERYQQEKTRKALENRVLNWKKQQHKDNIEGYKEETIKEEKLAEEELEYD